MYLYLNLLSLLTGLFDNILLMFFSPSQNTLLSVFYQ